MKSNKGITLISLIITIIILIILSGITINLTVGENGIFKKAKYAKEQYQMSQVKVKIELAIADIQIAQISKGEECTIDTLVSELLKRIEGLTIEKDGTGAKGTCEGYKYKIDENQKVTIEGYDTDKKEEILTPDNYTEFTVTAENRNMIGYTDETTELVIPETFEYEGVKYKVVAIGKDIHKTQEELGNMSEEERMNLMKEIPFMGCTNLTKVTIPDEVTTIGFYAFANCTSLTNITIPDSVTTIGDEAFYGCNSLTSIIIPDSVTTIGYGAFYNCYSLTSVAIPNSVTTIGVSAFNSCGSLTSVTIPNSVITIGDEAFYNCYSLTSVAIPNSVTTIGVSAFDSCGSLTNIIVDSNNTKYVSENGILFNKEKTELIQYPAGKTDTTYTIPDSVTTIGEYAFGNCASLTSITIPDSVITIGFLAFYNCDSLTNITVDSNNTKYVSENGILFNKEKTELIQYPAGKTDTTYIIPNSVTTIEDSAFGDCDSLTSVTMPDSVITIGDEAFYSCDSLTSVTMPDSVITIGKRAFYSCDSLTSVTISSSVTTIGDKAFYWCTKLTSVTMPDSVITIGSYAFWRCTSLTSVTIPDSVTTIGNNAFYKVPHIYYNGTATGSPWGAKAIN